MWHQLEDATRVSFLFLNCTPYNGEQEYVLHIKLCQVKVLAAVSSLPARCSEDVFFNEIPKKFMTAQ